MIYREAFIGRDAIVRELKAAHHKDPEAAKKMDPEAAKEMVERLRSDGNPRAIRAIGGGLLGLSVAILSGYVSTFLIYSLGIEPI